MTLSDGGDASAIRDDAPSPWWPCPECGSVHFKVTCTWVPVVADPDPLDDDDFQWEAFDLPRGKPTGIGTKGECLNCGTETDLCTHYDWPVIGETDTT